MTDQDDVDRVEKMLREKPPLTLEEIEARPHRSIFLTEIVESFEEGKDEVSEQREKRAKDFWDAA